MDIKKVHIVLIVTLLLGTLFAYYSVFGEYMEFYGMYKNLFRIKDCAIPNPITTPCFYGAFAFLISLLYSIKIKKMGAPKIRKHLKYLIILLVGSNIFAWGNNAIILYTFFTPSDKIGCSGRPIENPFTTPCFIGASIFLLALIMCFIVYRNTTDHNSQ